MFAVNGAFLVKPVTGVQRYAYEMLHAMSRHKSSDIVILAPGSFTESSFAGFPVVKDAWARRRRMWIWEQVWLPRLFRRSGAIGLWSPCNSGPYAITNQVVTIHDAAPFDHPEWFSWSFSAWYRFLLPLLARRARLVITDSNFSRERIAEWTKRSKAAIAVVEAGVGFRHSEMTADEAQRRCIALGVQDRFVLFTSSLEPRKNLERLLAAWSQIHARQSDAELVLVGGQNSIFGDPKFDGSVRRVRALGYVSDDDLAALYRRAELFVYPSLYEGFGLPPLEAMACGVPVLASHAGSLPEVLGDAAFLVDPLDVNSIADGLITLMANPDLRAELARKGKAHVRRFSWDRAADRALTLIKTALEPKTAERGLERVG